MDVFLILGYGVPKDIMTDDNYRRYLGIAFNTIWATSRKGRHKLVVFSGGNTDCFRPYQRTEAREMATYFKTLANRPVCHVITKNWKYLAENKSLSTLENLINTKRLLVVRDSRPAPIIIFCEQTRAQRVKILARKVFSGFKMIKVVPIDFDISANRYLDPAFINKKEQATLKLDRWALKNQKNFKKYHQAYLDRVHFLRRVSPAKHTNGVKRWWEHRLHKLGFNRSL